MDFQSEKSPITRKCDASLFPLPKGRISKTHSQKAQRFDKQKKNTMAVCPVRSVSHFRSGNRLASHSDIISVPHKNLNIR